MFLASIKNADNSVVSNQRLQGTRYNRLGKRTDMIGSVLDSDIINRTGQRMEENLGKGFVSLKVDEGDASKPLNIGGRLFYPSNNGTFRIVDDGYVKKIVELEKEKRAYIENIVEQCSMSNEVCATVLGYKTVADMQAALKGDAGGVVQDADLRLVDCSPEAIETYSVDSLTYSRAIQKLKIIVKDRMPILSNFTNETVINTD